MDHKNDKDPDGFDDINKDSPENLTENHEESKNKKSDKNDAENSSEVYRRTSSQELYE